MRTIFLILISFTAFAQKEQPTTDRAIVLKIDSTEREKIERWTLENTFPDIIVFVKDSAGNYIVGPEVLNDPAYEKLGIFDDTRKERTLKSFIEEKSETIEHKPKREQVTETSPVDRETKSR